MGWRTCRPCNGTGKEAAGEKVIDAIFSMGASAIVDALMGDDVMSKPCRHCGGSGEHYSATPTGDKADE